MQNHVARRVQRAVGFLLLMSACAAPPGYQQPAGSQPAPPPVISPEETLAGGEWTVNAEQGRPRVMVVVKRIPKDDILAVTDRMLEPETLEVLIADAFRSRGFAVVNAAAARENLRKDQLRRILEGDNRTAGEVGLGAEADVVVAGSVQESSVRRAASQTGEAADFIKVRLSARAIKTATGEVLGSTLLELEGPFSNELARQRAADSASAELSVEILKTWKSRTNITMIYADNADAQRVRLLKSTMVSVIREVDSILTYSLAGRSAVVVVYSALTSDQLLAQMDRCNTAIPFTIKGLSGTRIDIRFLDATGECKPGLR